MIHARGRAAETPGSCFFFLSYAPTVASAGERRVRGDHWVKRFYHDLETAVGQRTGLGLPQLGFCDVTLHSSEDRQYAVQEALAAAEVFVPLYSPAYLDRAESLSERESFRHKLLAAGQPPGGEHIQPVLWDPLLAPAHLPDRDHALGLAAEVDAYVENGMSALCRMDKFRTQYTRVLMRLARRIAHAAQQSPLRPVEPAPLVPVARPEPSEVPFLAAVIAPTIANLPAGQLSPNGYGPGVEHWRPFPGASPVVDDMAEVVERLRMRIEIREFVPDAGMFLNCPGILLLDPWILETDSGSEIVRAALSCLQSWVGIAIIVDPAGQPDARRAAAMLDQVRGILAAAAPPVVFTTAHDWRRGVPELVDRVRRRFLSQGPSFPPPGAGQGRPRLGDPGPPPEPADRDPADRDPADQVPDRPDPP